LSAVSGYLFSVFAVNLRWRHNEELHDLYSSPSIIRMVKARSMRWAGHVVRMGEKRNTYRLWWESHREGGH
jgi:hypothetical protein